MAFETSIIVITIIVIFLAVIVAYFISIYNGLIVLKNNIEKAWSNIDVLLLQRNDELPKLVATVKGYMKHEKEVLENITKARSAIMSAKTIEGKAKADNMISESLKTLFAVSENYPILRANDNFLKLQERITGIENMLADRRELYNDSVNNYNIRIVSIPDTIVARILGYSKSDLFKINEEQRKDVKIEF